MDRTGDYVVKQNKANSKREVVHVFSQMWNLKTKDKRT
jgi:hypothetical protein